MYLVKVNKKTKDWDIIEIKKNENIDLIALGFSNSFIPELNKSDLYISFEHKDNLMNRLEKDYLNN